MQVEECFSLSASPFFLTYTDDDGEGFPIRTEGDLTEAILYFDDADLSSSYSGSSSQHKVTIRLDVVVEYDGPSLSDTSSISSFRSGDESNESSLGSWRSNGDGESYGSYGTNGLGEAVIDEEEEGRTEYGGSAGRSLRNGMAALSLDIPPQPASNHATGVDRHDHISSGISPSSRSSWLSGRHRIPQSPQPPSQPPPLTGSDSDPVPSLLTHSELGSRWLREQSRLTTRRYGAGTAASRNSRRYESDDESAGSDEEIQGDLELVRNARGSTSSMFALGLISTELHRILLFLREY